MMNTTNFTYTAPGRPMPAPGELEAMRENMSDLVDLLSYARPHDSEGERTFVREWLLPRLRELDPNLTIDDFGNIWCEVPAKEANKTPWFLWSSHIDTVHNPKATRQKVVWDDDGRTLKLAKRKAGRCLGADDGAGIWLMLRMMAAGVAGGYVFHRGEEVGRLGSTWADENEKERLKKYDACVAFDRRDYDNLITHQMGERCCSENFAVAFASSLNATGHSLTYAQDDTGSYTDSYSYAYSISECINLSVGYDSEHGPRETLDALHLWRLAGSITIADLSAVPIERDCSFVDYGEDWGAYGGYSRGFASGGVEGSTRARMDAQAWGYTDKEWDEREGMLELIRKYPLAVLECLELYGLTPDEIAEHMTPLEVSAAIGEGLIGQAAASSSSQAGERMYGEAP